MTTKSLPIYNTDGAQVGVYEIDPAQLAPRINRQLLHDVVVMYEANQRLGTKRTKNRTDVAGTTKKMYRQKGTGHARAGSRRSGVRRGGGHMKSIRPRSFYYRLPRKAVQAATRMALASKILDDQLLIVQSLSFEVPKTSEMARILQSLTPPVEGAPDVYGQTVLVAVKTHDDNVYKSIRNLAGVSVTPAANLNALCVLKPRYVVVTTDALDWIRENRSANKDGQPVAGGAKLEAQNN